MRVIVLALVLLLVSWSSAARAHEARASEVDIEATSAFEARVVVRRGASLDVPRDCAYAGGILRCRAGLAGRELGILGRDLVLVRFTGEDGAVDSAVVTARAPTFRFPGRASRSSIVARFIGLGLEHVLTGLDHVLFLVALFWQAWRGRVRETAVRLAQTATAFTLGHSVTLGATLLGALHLRADVAEACIAWSLFLVALDVGVTNGRRVALAAVFGLVHGLGFAGAIAGTRLPEAARWTALVAFNAGIEVGQLVLFAACLGVALALRRVPGVLAARAPAACAWVVGVTGAALFFVRAASIFR